MENTEIVARGGDNSLLTLAIEKGLTDPAILKDLIALRNAEIERVAKTEFDLHFAEMQREFTIVGKTKEAKDSGNKRLYAYCPLEDILAMAAPIMAQHGFSYRWTETELPNKEKRINCIIAGYGHQETGFVDIPFMEPQSRATNIVQMRGSATTYGKRYSFLNATGIIVGGEDNDALSISRPGTVKAEVIPDDDSPGQKEAGALNGDPGTQPPPDPAAAIRDEIKAQISVFVSMSASLDPDGKDYFTAEEKADFKAKIAAINEGAKAAGDLGIKLRDLKVLNTAISEELQKRKGFSPLAQAMKDALSDKAVGSGAKTANGEAVQGEMDLPGAGRETF